MSLEREFQWSCWFGAMRFSAVMCVLVAAATVTGVSDDVVVPLCCPVGQIVGGIGTINDIDVIVCNDTDNPFIKEFEPIQNLSTRVNPLICPSIKRFPFGMSRRTNDTFGDYVRKMQSQKYGKDICFDFSMRRVSLRYCSVLPKTPQPPPRHWINTALSGLSVVLLVVSALLYITVKGLSTNPHSPYIVAHNLSLAMMYVTRIFLQFVPISPNVPECQYIAFALQFFTLTTFFWMSAMCLDVHITIRYRLDDEFVEPAEDYRRMMPPRDKRYPCNKKFAFLSLFAWGIPLLMTTLAICLEFMDGVNIDSPFKPNIARWEYSCFFVGPAREYLLRWPIAISVIVSVALFIATAVGLYQHERSMTTIQQNTNFSNDKSKVGPRYSQCFFLYLKLFVIMGITFGFGWGSDFFIKTYVKSSKEGTWPRYLSYMVKSMDYIYCLQGVFIFLLFVCKKRTLKILFEQFQSLRFLRCAARGSDDSGSAAGEQGVPSAVSKETIL